VLVRGAESDAPYFALREEMSVAGKSGIVGNGLGRVGVGVVEGVEEEPGVDDFELVEEEGSRSAHASDAWNLGSR
jgi:hypothetical protein